jgi:hypothetical protein
MIINRGDGRCISVDAMERERERVVVVCDLIGFGRVDVHKT